jgi:glycosyltransferase involved in cell wall biosynthesis
MECISGVICTLNEASNIGDCIDSITGVDEVIVADDGSTDGTVQIAREHGAKVIRRHDHRVRPDSIYVKAFKQRFGWQPSFTNQTLIRNGHLEAQEAEDAASHDWVVRPDADERVTWNLPYIREIILPQADQVVCDFVHSHNPDGSPDRVSRITKMWRRSKTQIVGRTHTCIIPNGVINYTRRMRVDHYQKPGHTQSYVLPIMEYCVVKDDDNRSRFYLGREYYLYHRYHEAITLLELYLSRADWIPEIAHARLYLARAFWESGKGDQAREHCREAVMLNPDFGEALYLMAELYYEPWSSKWRAVAERATNDGILF